MNPDFLRSIILKTSFNPEPLRRAQACLLLTALEHHTFTADCLPGEIVGDDTKLAGCAVGALASMGLIECVGRVKSPSKSRNGAKVSVWQIATGKAETARTWLRRHGVSVEQRQEELALA